jgi:hypothetical protein
VIVFFFFKNLLAYSHILTLPILSGGWFPKSFGSMIRRITCKKDNLCHHQKQPKSSSTMRKLKMKLPASSHLLGVEDIKQLLVWVILITITSLRLSFLDQHFIFGYLKSLIHYVWSPLSLQSFLFYCINSYLLTTNSSSLASLNLGVRFLVWGVVCHIPKFLFWNVNHFPQ